MITTRELQKITRTMQRGSKEYKKARAELKKRGYAPEALAKKIK